MTRRAWQVAGWLVAGALGFGALVSFAHAGERQPSGQALPVLQVWKQKHEMWLEQKGMVTRKFRVALGPQSSATKQYRGDGRTPVGTYYVVEKRPKSPFRHFLGINYPNIDDAERGFAEHLITADQWADILFATLRGEPPPSRTALGGRVGIHGYGGRPEAAIDWTQGCIAVSDADIDYLYPLVPIGTPVKIHD
jgi:murein L,D-transpeptidase YafK